MDRFRPFEQLKKKLGQAFEFRIVRFREKKCEFPSRFFQNVPDFKDTFSTTTAYHFNFISFYKRKKNDEDKRKIFLHEESDIFHFHCNREKEIKIYVIAVSG